MRETANLQTSKIPVLAAKIAVTALLLLAALPLFYLGILGVWALLRQGEVAPLFLLCMVATALVALNAIGTVRSFRHVPLFLAALAVFYLCWAFSVFPFPSVLPFPLYWVGIIFVVVTGLNAVLLFRSFHRQGLALKSQLTIAAQTLLFLVVFYTVLMGWTHPYGPDNLPVASIFWLAAFAIAGLNLVWIIRASPSRHQPPRVF